MSATSQPVLAGAGGDPGGARVLITGATSGLGLAMAEALVDGGAGVAVSGRDARRVAQTVARLRDRDGAALVVGAVIDVRDEASVDAGVGAAVDGLGGLNVLVNNAGLGMRTVNPDFLDAPAGFWEVDPDAFRAMIDTNLTGYFLVARRALTHLRASGQGRIVNVSMNHETMRRRGFAPYGPSRAGAEALSHIMAADLAPAGVAVNLLLPGGATLTGMIPDHADEALRSTLLPASVMGPPIRWLCSAAAAGVSDERIVATEFEQWRAARAPAA